MRNHQTDAATKYQMLQIPIFKTLLEKYQFLSGFKISINEQYIGIEKKYFIHENLNIFKKNNVPIIPIKEFWVYIEIEDAELLDEINCYEVWFHYHENNWLPSNEYEEIKSNPIEKSFFHTIDELEELLYCLNHNQLDLAVEIMRRKN